MYRKSALYMALCGIVAMVLLGGAVVWYQWAVPPDLGVITTEVTGVPSVRSSFSPANKEDAQRRADYEFLRLRNPLTGELPKNMRQRELAFARTLPTRDALLAKGQSGVLAANWQFRGPINVGGRTRALAIDLDFNGTTNRRILAGGVSGGMYISNNDGQSWTLASDLSNLASVTCLAQDPINRHVWYYGTGEFIANSAGGAGGFGYLGHGIFKSTDSGQSWQQLPSTIVGNSPTRFDDFFDYVWNVAVNPQTGTVFAATYGRIFRSTNAGDSWEELLGEPQPPYNPSSDVVIAPNGTVYITLGAHGLGPNFAGVAVSTNDGINWSNITPAALTPDPYRMVLDVSQSNPNIVYLLVQTTAAGEKASDHQLFRFDASSGNWTNLSAFLPDPAGVVGTFNSQGGYDLIVKIKPDDPNTVWVGGTNLYRSRDGGQNWDFVGGYLAPDVIALYENHHPDQHSMSFYPTNANAMISGHDGGLSKTTNSLEQPQTWTSLNNGYITSQFYAIALDPEPGSNFLLGGMQDNGTWRTVSADGADHWFETYGGDGGFAAITPGGLPFYVSSQNGNILRVEVQNNQLVGTLVKPASAGNFLFITPFHLDPTNPNVMYLAAGNLVWRNSDLSQIPTGSEPNDLNWTPLTNSAVAGTQVTALASSAIPAGRLYFGATDFRTASVIMRVDNPAGNGPGINITPPTMLGGTYPTCIGINPNDADELLVTVGNYGVSSIWHSTDGGQNWSEVEGNLGGDEGPSVRWSIIMPSGGSTVYFLATSTGVYSTTNLSGPNTVWVQEGASSIGNVVVDMLVGRPADGVVAAGTHARGVFSALVESSAAALLDITVQQLDIRTEPNVDKSTTLTITNSGGVPLVFSATAQGEFHALPKAPAQRALPNDNPAQRLEASRRQTAATLTGLLRDVRRESVSSSAADVLILDDGNLVPDDFIGNNDGVNDFYWLNRFQLGSQGFSLEGFDFYMRTELSFFNTVYVGVNDGEGNVLVSGFIDFNLAASGAWYSVTINNPIQFLPGDVFSIEIGADAIVRFPAGADQAASVPNNSFFYNPFQGQYVALGTIQGFENGAFLIRANGTLIGGGENQPPLAVARVSQTLASVGESITFDGSGSSDPDGSITQYSWDFGDGQGSNQQVATHAYAAAGTYNWSLTVTDNNGATGSTSGQVTISEVSSGRLSVAPASGTLNAGASAELTVTLDAQGLASGNYQGNITLNSNGGNRTIPVMIVVETGTAVENEPEIPTRFFLAPNYPNPFNPATQIRYELALTSKVRLQIFNTKGQVVRTLADGDMAAGAHQVVWDAHDDAGRRVASGLYFYRLSGVAANGEHFDFVAKMMLLK